MVVHVFRLLHRPGEAGRLVDAAFYDPRARLVRPGRASPDANEPPAPRDAAAQGSPGRRRRRRGRPVGSREDAQRPARLWRSPTTTATLARVVRWVPSLVKNARPKLGISVLICLIRLKDFLFFSFLFMPSYIFLDNGGDGNSMMASAWLIWAPESAWVMNPRSVFLKPDRRGYCVEKKNVCTGQDPIS